MTNLANAEQLRKIYLLAPHPEAKKRNICRASRNWNGCDYCDMYAGNGLECWKQGKKHFCCYCEQKEIEYYDRRCSKGNI